MIRKTLANFSDNDPRIGKYDNYFSIYEELISIRKEPIRLLEIGVRHGGSIELWRRVLPAGSEIVGIDIMPQTKQFAGENIEIVIGDQSNQDFLSCFSKQNGFFDIIIDDGSHVSAHQIATFQVLFFNNLNNGGHYIVEDTHTSYWRDYGGGLRKRSSFIEFTKRIIDDVNAWHGAGIPRSAYTRSIKRIYFEASIVVIEKAAMSAPKALHFGGRLIDNHLIEDKDLVAVFYNFVRQSDRLKRILRRVPLTWWTVNKILRARK